MSQRKDDYQGDGLPPDGNSKKRYAYLAEPDLVEAVRMARHLRHPILIKGPPGCGKTKLAAAVAHELALPLHEWYVKSTSRARDGLYTIDSLRRLHDAQFLRDATLRIVPYLRFGPLGDALRSPDESVVLIDEIDKADIDFPNDLLLELDRKMFTIEELYGSQLSDEEKAQGYRHTYDVGQKAIIVITSNDEKELPDAFLRRCLFHYIKFPEKERLLEIVSLHCGDRGALIEAAVDRLLDFRKNPELRKPPSTSELIDWVNILIAWQIKPEAVREALPPRHEVLFKHLHDLESARRHAGKGKS